MMAGFCSTPTVSRDGAGKGGSGRRENETPASGAARRASCNGVHVSELRHCVSAPWLSSAATSGSTPYAAAWREMAHFFTGCPLRTCRHPLGRHVKTAHITGHVERRPPRVVRAGPALRLAVERAWRAVRRDLLDEREPARDRRVRVAARVQRRPAVVVHDAHVVEHDAVLPDQHDELTWRRCEREGTRKRENHGRGQNDRHRRRDERTPGARAARPRARVDRQGQAWRHAPS